MLPLLYTADYVPLPCVCLLLCVCPRPSPPAAGRLLCNLSLCVFYVYVSSVLLLLPTLYIPLGCVRFPMLFPLPYIPSALSPCSICSCNSLYCYTHFYALHRSVIFPPVLCFPLPLHSLCPNPFPARLSSTRYLVVRVFPLAYVFPGSVIVCRCLGLCFWDICQYCRSLFAPASVPISYVPRSTMLPAHILTLHCFSFSPLGMLPTPCVPATIMLPLALLHPRLLFSYSLCANLLCRLPYIYNSYCVPLPVFLHSLSLHSYVLLPMFQLLCPCHCTCTPLCCPLPVYRYLC